MTTRQHTGARRHDVVREEVERYRRAAEETLEQVDWCIGYLYRIRKPEIARALESNRSTIRRQMERAGR
jgi:hypothetical protein